MDQEEKPKMSLIEKATLAAQLSAPLALLATVVFSWLSWSESRRASEIQLEMFAAQNAPRLVFSRLSISEEPTGPEAFLYAENSGGSRAFKVCLEAHLGMSEAGFQLQDSCSEGSEFSVDAGSEGFVGAVPLIAAEGEFHQYSDYRLIGLGDEIIEEQSIFVRLRYRDTFGNLQSVSSTFQGVRD